METDLAEWLYQIVEERWARCGGNVFEIDSRTMDLPACIATISGASETQ
jgi:hypothetical protein